MLADESVTTTDANVNINIIDITEKKKDFMFIRSELRKCGDPVETAEVVARLRAETGLTKQTLDRCVREIERERREQQKEYTRKINGKKDEKTENKKGEQIYQGSIPLQLNAKGKPYPIIYNAMQVLRFSEEWQNVLRFNLFSATANFNNPPPYITANKDGWIPVDIKDTDDTLTAAWLQQHFMLHVTSNIAREAIDAVALDNTFHPVQDYLNNLSWDNTPRLNYWLSDFFGVKKTNYTMAAASKTLISAVARVFSPAAKVDTVLTLIGPQGWGKSKAWKILASPWFDDSLLDMHSKDALQHLRGRWIVELAELSAMQRQDIESVKRFLSCDTDGYRASYGHRDQSYPRQCIFVATTNTERPLKDSTGNRRWWPVEITQELHEDGLRESKDQLWAEAVVRYKSGEVWYMIGNQREEAATEQHNRVEIDDWQEKITAWINEHPETVRIPILDVHQEILSLKITDISPLAQRRVAGIMRHIGWVSRTMRHPITGHPCRGFAKS